jgi:hypothetical protein
MQRWKHARVGPRCALLAGVLLGVASLALYQSAYAAEPGYPGPPGLPGIPNGPSLGCNDSGTTNQTWVCGFNPLSTITFLVNGHAAGTAEATSNGCVLIVVSFLSGDEVQINANAPVKVKPGVNVLKVLGVKTSSKGTGVVGLKLSFRTPSIGTALCVTTPTTQPSIPASILPSSVATTSFPRETTIHGYYPTTLAKVLETPLVISPNKVILESSLLAGVLAAALSAGALGAMWGGNSRDVSPVAAAPEAAGVPPDEPEPEVPPASPSGDPLPTAPPEPPAPSAPAPTPSPPAAPPSPIVPNAFVRPPADPNRGIT